MNQSNILWTSIFFGIQILVSILLLAGRIVHTHTENTFQLVLGGLVTAVLTTIPALLVLGCFEVSNRIWKNRPNDALKAFVGTLNLYGRPLALCGAVACGAILNRILTEYFAGAIR